jgi:hypothetical protein
MTEPLALTGDAIPGYLGALGAALEALRLNRTFPEWERVRAHLAAMARRPPDEPLRIDPTSGLPIPREWVRARVEAELRGESALLPARAVTVALRNVRDGVASYAVQVDRLDVVTATVARYSLVVADRPGRVVSVGQLDLQPSPELRAQLELLSTQDAALGFAVLEQEGVRVEEVVRGVIGPAALPGAGPSLPVGGLVLSACLERASIDLEDQRVDDPLADSVTLFSGARVGLTRARRWAVPTAELAAFTAWLRGRGSRNLVYGYGR